ncbi:hypothetical protein D3C73_1554330 [compost metagenome]
MEPAKLAAANSGCVTICENLECTNSSSHSRKPRDPWIPSPRAGSARKARVTGAPRTRKIGATMVRAMWSTMCAENRTRP